MSVCLSALLSCKLSLNELFRFPKILSRFSNEFYWYESGPPESMTVENCAYLIEEGYLWISGPDNIRIIPGLESIEVCYGWNHSRFFTGEQKVSNFIDFCTALSKQLGCIKIYFLTNSECETFNYQQITQLISSGKLTEGKECDRLSERCNYDIYAKELSDSVEGTTTN